MYSAVQLSARQALWYIFNFRHPYAVRVVIRLSQFTSRRGPFHQILVAVSIRL
jgi:hypothetical protein